MGEKLFRAVIVNPPSLNALLFVLGAILQRVIVGIYATFKSFAASRFHVLNLDELIYTTNMPGFRFYIESYLAVYLLLTVMGRLVSISPHESESPLGALTRSLSPWRSVVFRDLAYGSAIYGGKAWRWLTSSWRPHLLGLIAFAALGVAWRFLAAGAALPPNPPRETAHFGPAETAASFLDPLGVARWLQNIVDSGIAGAPLTEMPAVSLFRVVGEALHSLSFLAMVVVAYALAWVGAAYWRGRNRMLILPPANHAGESFKDFADGLELRIMNELKRLGDLHSLPDSDATAGPSDAPGGSAGRNVHPVSALRIGVDDDIARFAAIIDDTAAISLGPAKVSLKPLFNLIASLTRGNLLRSSLHRNGNTLLLVAELGSGGAWRIAGEIPGDASPEERAKRLSAMLDELVYSVFSSFSRLSGLNWRALQRFSLGLRALRDGQSSQLHRFENLGAAEEHFLAARGLARSFDRCSYLLGVVYVELADFAGSGQPDAAKRQAANNWRASARAAFIQALEENPQHLDAAYGIAWQSYLRGAEDNDQYAFAVEFADRMIAIERTDARAWHIRGEALRQLRGENPADKRQSWKSTLDNLETAAAFLWRRLCARIWAGGVPAALRADQADYLTNLGVTIWNSGLGAWRAKRVLRQALRGNFAARPAFEMARILDFGRTSSRFFGGRFPRSVWSNSTIDFMYKRALFATKSFGDRTRIRAWFALSLFERREDAVRSSGWGLNATNVVQDAFAKLIESPSLIAQQEQTGLLSLLSNSRLPDDEHWFPSSYFVKLSSSSPTSNGRLVLWTAVYRERLLEKLPYGDLGINYCSRSKLPDLRKSQAYLKLPSYYNLTRQRNQLMWLKGYFNIFFGAMLINESYNISNLRKKRSMAARGVHWLLQGISIYDQPHGFPREQMLVVAYAKLSEAQTWLSQLDATGRELAELLVNSVANAERAKARAPFDANRYMALLSSHAARCDFNTAEKLAAIGHSLSPGNEEFLYRLGMIYWNVGAQMIDRMERRKYFSRVISSFDTYLLQLIDDDARGYIHFWLGRFLGDLREYDLSTMHYRTAKNFSYNSIEVGMYLAWNFLEQEQQDLAKYYLNDMIYLLKISRRRFLAKNRGQGSIAALADRWLGELDEGAAPPESKQPFGYLFPQAVLFDAIIACGRGDYSRAQRRVDFAARVIKRYPLRMTGARNILVEQANSRRALYAQCLDVRGRIAAGQGHRKEAMKTFEDSLKIREDVGTAYQLASLMVSEAEGGKWRRESVEKAARLAAYARNIDIRNVYSDRLEKLESRLNRLDDARPFPARSAAERAQ